MKKKIKTNMMVMKFNIIDTKTWKIYFFFVILIRSDGLFHSYIQLNEYILWGKTKKYIFCDHNKWKSIFYLTTICGHKFTEKKYIFFVFVKE